MAVIDTLQVNGVSYDFKDKQAYVKPASGIPASDIASGVIPDVSNFITKSVDDLMNYYLKSETYTKAEVQALINAIKQFTYQTAQTLPTASADTMHIIYLVPSSDPQTQNVKDEYITIDNGAEAQTRYTWEQIGSTAIDLSGYVTTTALNTALANYTTTTDLTTLLAGKQDVISDLDTIRSGAEAGATAYQKPSGGIPSTDLASEVQTSLGKADAALPAADVVDNLTTNDATKVLSAKQGKVLDGKVSQLGQQVDEDFVAKDNENESEIKDSSDKFAIADSDGNAIAEFDADGLKTTNVSAHHLNGSNIGLYDDKFLVTDNDGYVVCMIDKDGIHATKINSLGVLKNTWAGKVIATYGDSITAVNNGDFEYPYIVSGYNWGLEVAKFFSFSKNYGRGIGSTCFMYREHGGQVAWVKTATGEYVDRNDLYTYDDYIGHVTIPDDCTAIRGDGSSWLRLTSMFPASIRGTIDVVLVMFHNDFHKDLDTDVEWIPNDATDPEWAASTEYSALGGDYNIGTVKGGIASVVMKLQALMPQATIILMTPIGGVYTSAGENSGDFNNTETAKMKKLADCVLDVAQRMSTPTINVYGNCGINTLNRATYIADTIHPYTIAGRKKIGRAVCSGLMNQIAL